MAIKSLPRVETLPASASVSEVVEAIKIAGGCIIKGVLTPEEVEQIKHDITPALDADLPWPGAFFPSETRRAMGLLSQSSTFARALVMNPLYLAVSRAFLEEKYWCWSGTEKLQNVSPIQLHNTVAFRIGPGAKAQGLHRDDHCHLRKPTEIEKYPENPGESQRDFGLGFFVAGSRTTKENGATRFIPGSHLYGYEHEPEEELSVYAELEPGDGFMMLASCFHGGSENKTKDQQRLVYSCFTTRGWVRQEENQYLTYPLDEVKTWPVELQKLMGYELSEPFCGWVHGKDPRSVLDPSIGLLNK